MGLPFKVSEVNRKGSSVTRLGGEEFRWLASEMVVRFCAVKGDPLWVRTFKRDNGFYCSRLGRTLKENLSSSLIFLILASLVLLSS